jgi:DinB superfamily
MTLEQTSTGTISQAPVGCSLCDDQLSARMQVVADVFAGSEEYRELSDGYEFRFPGTTEWAIRLTEFIASERNCCTFFKFGLVFEPNQGPVWLRVRGGENAKEFIRRLNTGSSQAPAMPVIVDTSQDKKEGTMNSAQTDQATATIPDREAIRAELEATRLAYHDLVKSISPDEWKTKSANPSWRVGQILWHLAWGAGYFPRGVEECRNGKDRNPPTWIMNPMNKLITRIGSRGATPQSVLSKYDANHARILACLDGVQDDEWNKGVKPLGAFGVYKTIESVFHSVSMHFREHEADTLQGLQR